MARRTKPFEQHSTRLPDGRSVVTASTTEPRELTFWMVGTSRAEVLGRLRSMGFSGVHVDSGFRPGAEAARLAGEDPAGFVFGPRALTYRPGAAFPSHLLAGHLADPDRPLPR